MAKLPELQPLPMPPAPLPAQPRWRKRLRTACLLSLACVPLVFLSLVSPDILGPFAAGFRWGAAPVVAAVAWVSAWLLTTPDPTDGSWLRASRWVIRASAVTQAVYCLLWLLMGAGICPSASGPVALATLILLLALFSMVGGVAAWGYRARLADRLGDRALRANFNVWKWIVGVLLVVSALGAIAFWPESAERYALHGTFAPPRDPEVRQLGHKIGWFCLCAGACTWYGWLIRRLMRRLRLPGEAPPEASSPSSLS